LKKSTRSLLKAIHLNNLAKATQYSFTIFPALKGGAIITLKGGTMITLKGGTMTTLKGSTMITLKGGELTTLKGGESAY
jgi:hypothetical protein